MWFSCQTNCQTDSDNSDVLFRPQTMRTLLTLALLAHVLSGVPADNGFDSAPAAKRGGRIEIKYCMS